MDKHRLITRFGFDGVTIATAPTDYALVDGWTQGTLAGPAGILPAGLFGKVPAGDPYLAHINVLSPAPLISGVVVRCRPIGMLKMSDEAGEDTSYVLHAGTSHGPEGIVSAGGRVLSVVGLGADLAAARAAAYAQMERIALPGGHFRRDIALAAQRDEIRIPG